ncbi:MAG: TIGR03546 family protein [Candidatus Omnitrophica bacterium]|nr:TIGR03546 family protein [Candidatus Omnitrophota bacterium]
MLPLINLPVKIVKLFTSNVSESEVAAGVVMGMFFGFIPLNGPMAILLFVLFFIFRINRLASILVLPVFKLFYVLGVYRISDMVGGLLLIDLKFLSGVWRILTSLPVIAYLDLGNTLVTGGLVVSGVLAYPVYLASKKGIVVFRKKYFDKFKQTKFYKWFMKLPVISKIVSLANRR